ncbi:MAG: GerMN domain-containing protein [Patescibacteria group bacterium]
MKTTPYVLGFVVLVILAGAVGLAFKNKGDNGQVVVIKTYEECVAAGYPVMESYPEQCKTPDGKTYVNKVTPVVDTNVSNMIHVENPVAQQIVASGFELRGEARGIWYFEASFPAKLLDANDKVIAQFPVQAQGDWMTTDFVSFKQIVTFSIPETSTGKLILQKDNPSGLPENNAELVIPIKFATSSSANMMTVKVFFSNSTLAGVQNTDCSKVFATSRSILKTSTTGKAALEELLKGPSISESGSGYITNLNSDVKLNSLIVTNGVARADFNATLDSGVAGSCRVTAIRSQIEQTLKQFSSISQVVISINGQTSQVLQP